jgi:zinc transport system substrate-binding protein
VLLQGGHLAFGYLAERYGLDYRAATAVNPDAEPTPARIAELVRQVRTHRLRYVFSEELVSPRLAETIARETGAGVLPLNAAHSVSREEFAGGVTFLALMERNLANLATGLGCR